MVNFNSPQSVQAFTSNSNDYNVEYEGTSIFAVGFETKLSWIPSPILLYDYDNTNNNATALATSDTFITDFNSYNGKILNRITEELPRNEFKEKVGAAYRTLELNNNHQIVKDATLASSANEATSCRLMYQGTSMAHYTGQTTGTMTPGSGHHGNDYVGVAAVRNGKQLLASAAPAVQMLNTNNNLQRG